MNIWAEEPETPEELLIRKQEFSELVRRSPMRTWVMVLRRAGLTVPEIARVTGRTTETALHWLPRSDVHRHINDNRMDAAAMEARPKICEHCGLAGVSAPSRWHSACVQSARLKRVNEVDMADKRRWSAS